MKSKNINIVCTGTFTFPFGMAGTQIVKRYIDYCLAGGCTVSVFTILQRLNKKDNNTFRGLYKNKVQYRNLGYISGLRVVDILQYPIVLFYSIILLVLWKNKSYKNILFVYDNINLFNVIPILFAKAIGYKITVEIVEDFKFSEEEDSAIRKLNIKSAVFLEKKIQLFADSIIVVSKYLEAKFQTLSNGQIPVLLIPVSTEIRNNGFKRDSEDNYIFLYAGTFDKKDGLEILVKAFDIFNKRYPESELRFIGKTNHISYLDNLMINKNIKYLGPFYGEDYFSQLYHSNVLCMTRTNSKFANAGFPHKIAEYLSTGIPVICSDVSDIKYYLEHRKDALIIEPDNVSELVNAMEFLYLNRELANHIGANGKSKADRYFNSYKNGKLFFDFISE